jgi:hypothetical protein
MASFLELFHPIETQAKVISDVGLGTFNPNSEFNFAIRFHSAYIPTQQEVVALSDAVNAFLVRVRLLQVVSNRDIQATVGEVLYHHEPFMVAKLASEVIFNHKRTAPVSSAAPTSSAVPTVSSIPKNDNPKEGPADDEGVSFFKNRGCLAKKK